MTSPTQLSLKGLKEKGYSCQVVEHYNMFAHKRIDLFHVIDIIAIKEGEILGVQSTTFNHATDHRQKIKQEPLYQEWLKAGGKFELQMWRKIGNRWQIIIETPEHKNLKLA